MTYQNNFTLPEEIMEQIATNGMDHLLELIRTMITTTMQIEPQRYLKAGLYERHKERQGHPTGKYTGSDHFHRISFVPKCASLRSKFLLDFAWINFFFPFAKPQSNFNGQIDF